MVAVVKASNDVKDDGKELVNMSLTRVLDHVILMIQLDLNDEAVNQLTNLKEELQIAKLEGKTGMLII